MSNKSINPDKAGNSTSDLKKLYSAHVQENFTLHKQKRELDSAKVKKIRELTKGETAFLKKYDKYISSGRASRRSSIDAGLASALEANFNAQRSNSRVQDQIFDKSFARDAISSDCPYSLETWNRLVDREKSLVEENKRNILFDEDKCVDKDKEESSEDFENSINMMKLTNKLESGGMRFEKKQTLKPIQMENELIDEDVIDPEITELQTKQKQRGRRHSIALGTLSRAVPNTLNSVARLPGIGETGVFNKRKNSLSNPDFPREQVPGPVDVNAKKALKSNRSLSLADNVSSSKKLLGRELETDINNANKTDEAADCNEVPEIKVIPPINEPTTPKTTGLDTILKAERPVPTAAIFIQGESDSLPHNKVDGDLLSPRSCLQVAKLPDIGQSAHKPENCDTEISNTKHVTFDEETIQGRSNSDASLLSDIDGRIVNSARSSRRSSLTIESLKLLVDSHHGAAKLRYIAKLASEMEKVEAAKHPTEPEPDIYKELSQCRYLRAVPREDSTLTEGSRE